MPIITNFPTDEKHLKMEQNLPLNDIPWDKIHCSGRSKQGKKNILFFQLQDQRNSGSDVVGLMVFSRLGVWEITKSSLFLFSP